MKRLALVLVLACNSKSNDAPKPAAPPPPPPAEKAAEPKPPDVYETHMKAGDQLENQKKWSDALGEFEQALAAKPNDPHALGEVSFTAFFAGKLDRAREAAEAAVTAAGADAKLKASALFNLGLSIEKQLPNAAAALYVASDKLRPNGNVKARLAKVVRDSYEDVRVAKADGDALLKKLGVDAFVPPTRRKDPTKIDAPMLAVFDAAQAQWEWGAGHGAAIIENVACSQTGTTYSCTNPQVTPEVAKQLVDNLVARKVKGTKTGDRVDYKVSQIRCASYDVETEGGRIPADTCEVTP